jgi:outer membrane immunogenic protein
LTFQWYLNFLTVEMAPPAGDLPRRLVCRCAESATAKAPEVRYGLSTMVDELTVGSAAQHLQSSQTGGTVRSLQQYIIEGCSMKKLAIAVTAVAVLTGSALAADMPAKARSMAPVPVGYNWTGCYVGAGGGYGMWNQENTVYAGGVVISPEATAGGRGWFGTVQGGCDYQFAPNWVVGAFGDFDFGSIKGTPTALGVFGEEKLSSSWAAGGRVGYVIMPQLLAYFSGGYTQAHFDQINFNVPGLTEASHTYDGFFLGSGYEYGLGWLPGLFWKTEYRFADYGTDRNDLLLLGVPTGVTIDQHKYVQTIRSELVYRFNWMH